MKSKRHILLIFILMMAAISITAGICQALTPEQKSRELVLYYFDMLLSKNYETANGLWEPSSYARATRLGIKYEDIPVKIDCNSPAVYDFEQGKEFIRQGVVSSSKLEDDVFRWMFRVKRDNETINHFYYTVKIGDYFWLITPQDYYSRDWLLIESKYFRFYINPLKENLFNEIMLQSLDEFVEDIAEKLNLSSEGLDFLAERKIDYYFCQSPSEVTKLSYKNSTGVYDPATDAVVSSVMPDYFEIARLLINYRFRRLPLFSLPVINHGLAASLAGRWQRSPEVVFNFGAYILRYDIITLDSILSSYAYTNQSGGDIVYPVSALFGSFLYSHLDQKLFDSLYLALSGDYTKISALDYEGIKSIICSTLNRDWESLKSEFLQFSSDYEKSGGTIRAGINGSGNEIISDSGLKISLDDNNLRVEYKPENDTLPSCTFLFGRTEALNGKTSLLFKEQFRGPISHDNFRYGIRMDKNEIGLYDYATNRIMAKFVDRPDIKSDYYDSDKNRLAASINLKVFNKILPDKKDYKVIR